MITSIRSKIKNYTPKGVKRLAVEFFIKSGIGLPRHPYPEQFSPDMDCQERDWAERFILVASTPRCGSHYLGHMLGATGECGVPLEYLNRGNAKYWGQRFKTSNMDVLFKKFVQHRTSSNGTFTLKAHWDQFEPYIDSIDKMTRCLGFEKVLWIYRRNQLSQAISKVIADQTGVWISGAAPKTEAKFDYSAIVRSATSIHSANMHWLDFINSLPPERSIAIAYEDLLSDEDVRDRICSFLELSIKLGSSDRTQKQGGSINDLWKKRFIDEIRQEDRWILGPPSWL